MRRVLPHLKASKTFISCVHSQDLTRHHLPPPRPQSLNPPAPADGPSAPCLFLFVVSLILEDIQKGVVPGYTRDAVTQQVQDTKPPFDALILSRVMDAHRDAGG